MTAWEVTENDIDNVLRLHGLRTGPYEGKQGDMPLRFSSLQAVSDALDHETVVDEALQWLTMSNQTDAASCEIERQLIELGVLTGPKCQKPDDSDDDDWDDEDESDEETDDDDWDQEEDEQPTTTLRVGDTLTVQSLSEDEAILVTADGRKYIVDLFSTMEYRKPETTQDKPELNVGPFPDDLPFKIVDVHPERNG